MLLYHIIYAKGTRRQDIAAVTLPKRLLGISITRQGYAGVRRGLTVFCRGRSGGYTIKNKKNRTLLASLVRGNSPFSAILGGEALLVLSGIEYTHTHTQA